MTEKVKHIPSHEEVRQIFNEIYNAFYKKWVNSSTPYNTAAMLREAHELNRKYDCDLCRHMLADLIECIEDEWRRRQGSE